jgi:hypothetical protein
VSLSRLSEAEASSDRRRRWCWSRIASAIVAVAEAHSAAEERGTMGTMTVARSAGVAERALVVLHGQLAAGAPEPAHHDRAPRLVHQ